MSLRPRRLALAALALLSVASQSPAARADPYRLQADALGQSRADRVGLIALGGRARPNEWVSAEASVWAGAGTDVDADVLTLVVRVREPSGLGDAQLGRFVIGPGAIRPIHVDGVAGRLRLPLGFGVEAFGGIPVTPRFDNYGELDWVVGGRVSYALGDYGSVGLAYMHRRNDGFLADQEVGVDFGAPLADWLDLAGRVAMDLTDDPGLSEANLSLAAHDGPFRVELFGIQRSPSRILPATSLFTVLGDVPSRLGGANARWRLAPRLDLRATGAIRLFDDTGAYESLLLGATLRLDDTGDGALGLEGRREGTPEGGWTGVRATARVPLGGGFGASTEIEIVVPDGRQRGDVWPWGLLALRYDLAGWEISAAALASSSPEYVFRFDALLRVATRWEGG
jgi:hypothetical protein